jgi:disulfide bond formation protein DsbB
MIQRLLAGRTGYLLGFLACFGMVAFALYIQQKEALEPCPLCIFQRIAFMAMGVAFLAAALHHPGALGRKIYAGLQFSAATAGMGIAMRHIWIQSHPDEVMSECGAGIGYMFERFPLHKVLELVFKGTGECSSVDWTLLGFTIPQLSLLAFVLLGGYALALAFVKGK